MNNENLHDAIGMIDDDLLSETDSQRKIAKRRTNMFKYLSIAACVCLLVGATMFFGILSHMNSTGKPPITDVTDAVHDEIATEAQSEESEIEKNETEGGNKNDIAEDSVIPAGSDVKPSLVDPNENASDTLLNLSAKDMLADVSAEPVIDQISPVLFSKTISDFSVKLFKSSSKGVGNEVISPLSALYAMAMCAMGAEGETLAQIEDTVGMTADELQTFLHFYMNSLPTGEGYKLSLANSAWIKDVEGFSVSEDYLRDITSYLNADVYKAPFDHTTVADINKWVSDRTNGLIENLLDYIHPEILTYLINTLFFEAEWERPFEWDFDYNFILEDGTVKKCRMMSEFSSDGYIEDCNTTGFVKYLKDNSYAFVAMLPKEGLTIAEYLETLNGEKLHSLVKNVKDDVTRIFLPKFSAEYDTSLTKPFINMGITDAFSPSKASFPSFKYDLQNIHIADVHQKTVIRVDEIGTKAGTVTYVSKGFLSDTPSSYTVCLDRPFVYMIIDCQNSIPLYFGTVTDIGE